MAYERIDIVITERGSRVVRRNIHEIGQTANQSGLSVDVLKRALLGLGAGLSARELLRTVDTFTHLQNRLRATGLEGQKLTTVYRELLGVANETRSSVTKSVELYARLAISSKELGVSQQELINFTRSLNQAIILSGASVQEANAGLIQLSQGMASGTLRGDELRSVLEQLPAVADVIAKYLGVTRGELRALGEAGEITATVILEAFAAARTELSARFGKTVSLIGQAFQILKNNVINAVGDLDKLLNIGGGVASVILAVADNVPQLTQALVNLTKVLVSAGAAYAAFFVSQKISVISEAIASFIAYRKAIASGTVVALGSAEAERQKTLATYQAAVADAAATESALSLARAEEASALSKLNNTRAVASQLAAERALEVTRLQAQISDKGRTQSLTRLAEIRRAEAAIMQIVAREEAALNAVRTAGVAVDNARASSLLRLQEAQAANAAATTAAAGTTSLLGQAITKLRVITLAFFALLAANPITALVVVLASAVTALTLFRDQIKLGTDEITTLGDLMRAIGEAAGPAFRKVYDAARVTFGPLVDLISGFFDEVDFSIIGILRLTARGVDGFVGLWRGAIDAVIVLFKGLPAVLGDLFTRALNVLLSKITGFVNGAIELLGPLTDLVNIDIQPVDFLLANDSEGAAAEFGADIGNAFKEGFESINFAEGLLDSLTARAQEIGRQRKAVEEAAAAGGADLSAGGGRGPSFSAAQLKELEQLISRYDQVYKAQQEYKMGVQLLDQATAAGALTEERRLEILALMQGHLNDALDPLGALNREMEQENELLGLTADQREITNQLRTIEQDLLTQGIILGEAELAQIHEKLMLLQEETKISAARDQILQSTIERQEEFATQLQAINQLVAEGLITQGQATAYLVEQNQTLLEGTIEAQQAWVEQYNQTYTRIDELRQQDLISEQTAIQLKARAQADLNAQRLANAQTFFGNLASLSRTGNRELVAIGQAAAVTQATIDGVVAVQKALASAPPPANYALAASVGVATAANVASILSQNMAGYAFGGDFEVGGTGGTDSQLVAFRATPGESVSVRTPTQKRDEARQRSGENQQSAAGTRIVNVLDPALVGDFLSTSEGEQVLVNVMRRNSDSIRQVIQEG